MRNQVFVIVSLLILMGNTALTQNTVCFNIDPNPNPNDPALSGFTKFINVFGIGIYAEDDIPDEKVKHVAAIFAEWLDNNEDSIVDNTLVHDELLQRETIMPVFSYEGSPGEDVFFNNYNGQGVAAVCYKDEIIPQRPLIDIFDATVEEVLHTISSLGYANAYPTAFSEAENSISLLTQAMDTARGGHFVNIPNPYPENAWYHYDDYTCEYNCMATEYFYWGLTSMLGIQDYGNRCNEIVNEWEACTAIQFQSMDTLLFNLFSDPVYQIPVIAPDGNYCPSNTGVGSLRYDNTKVKVYPNPCKEKIVFENISHEETNISLISIEGIIVKEALLNNRYLTMDIRGLSNGVYLVMADGRFVQKITIVK